MQLKDIFDGKQPITNRQFEFLTKMISVGTPESRIQANLAFVNHPLMPDALELYHSINSDVDRAHAVSANAERIRLLERHLANGTLDTMLALYTRLSGHQESVSRRNLIDSIPYPSLPDYRHGWSFHRRARALLDKNRNYASYVSYMVDEAQAGRVSPSALANALVSGWGRLSSEELCRLEAQLNSDNTGSDEDWTYVRDAFSQAKKLSALSPEERQAELVKVFSDHLPATIRELRGMRIPESLRLNVVRKLEHARVELAVKIVRGASLTRKENAQFEQIALVLEQMGWTPPPEEQQALKTELKGPLQAKLDEATELRSGEISTVLHDTFSSTGSLLDLSLRRVDLPGSDAADNGADRVLNYAQLSRSVALFKRDSAAIGYWVQVGIGGATLVTPLGVSALVARAAAYAVLKGAFASGVIRTTGYLATGGAAGVAYDALTPGEPDPLASGAQGAFVFGAFMAIEFASRKSFSGASKLYRAIRQQ